MICSSGWFVRGEEQNIDPMGTANVGRAGRIAMVHCFQKRPGKAPRHVRNDVQMMRQYGHIAQLCDSEEGKAIPWR